MCFFKIIKFNRNILFGLQAIIRWLSAFNFIVVHLHIKRIPCPCCGSSMGVIRAKPKPILSIAFAFTSFRTLRILIFNIFFYHFAIKLITTTKLNFQNLARQFLSFCCCCCCCWLWSPNTVTLTDTCKYGHPMRWQQTWNSISFRSHRCKNLIRCCFRCLYCCQSCAQYQFLTWLLFSEFLIENWPEYRSINAHKCTWNSYPYCCGSTVCSINTR